MKKNTTGWTLARKLRYDILVWHCRHRYFVYISLVAILIVVLAIASAGSAKQAALLQMLLQPRSTLQGVLVRLDTATKLVSLARDLLSILALLVAAAWVYYQFIKGRTFSPKLDLDVEYVGLCGHLKDFALLRLVARNEGRTRVEPYTVLAKCYYGVTTDGHIQYRDLCESEGLLDEFFQEPETTRTYLEPQDSLKVDFEVPLGSIPPEEQSLLQEDHCVLKVRFYVQDANRYTWQRIKVLIIDRHRSMS
jgi:hypothetical protein